MKRERRGKTCGLIPTSCCRACGEHAVASEKSSVHETSDFWTGEVEFWITCVRERTGRQVGRGCGHRHACEVPVRRHSPSRRRPNPGKRSAKRAPSRVNGRFPTRRLRWRLSQSGRKQLFRPARKPQSRAQPYPIRGVNQDSNDTVRPRKRETIAPSHGDA